MAANNLTEVQKNALGDCLSYLLTRLAGSKNGDLTVPLPGLNGQIAGNQVNPKESTRQLDSNRRRDKKQPEA